jgi:O-antigen/teichoic acid export membrane protein
MPVDDLEALDHTAQRVAKNTTVVFLGQVISLFANLAVTVLLARYLGKAGFGLFSYAIVLVSFSALVADFGMKPILVREIARKPERAEAILGNAIFVKLVLCLLAVALAGAATLMARFSAELKVIIWILAGNILISSKLITVRNLFELVFQVRLRMQIPVLFQALDALVLMAATVVAIQQEASLRTIAAIYVLSNLPGFFLTLIWSQRAVKPQWQLDSGLCRMFFKEALPLFFYVVFMAFYDRLDLMLLQSMKGESFVGLYAAASRLVAPLNFIPLAIVTSLYPLMSNYSFTSPGNLEKAYLMGLKILATFGIALALVISVLGAPIFELLYSPAFTPAANAFKLLIWAQAFGLLNFFFVDYNTSVDRQRRNLWAAFAMCLVNLALDLVLIPKWDIVGASLAKLLTNLVGFGMLFAFSYTGDSKIVVNMAAKLAAVAALFLGWLTQIKSTNLFIALPSSAVVYLLLLMLFGIFDVNERQLFSRLLRRSN